MQNTFSTVDIGLLIRALLSEYPSAMRRAHVGAVAVVAVWVFVPWLVAHDIIVRVTVFPAAVGVVKCCYPCRCGACDSESLDSD